MRNRLLSFFRATVAPLSHNKKTLPNSFAPVRFFSHDIHNHLVIKQAQVESLGDIKARIDSLKKQYSSYGNIEERIFNHYKIIVDSPAFQRQLTQARLTENQLAKMTWYLIELLYQGFEKGELEIINSSRAIAARAIELAAGQVENPLDITGIKP